MTEPEINWAEGFNHDDLSSWVELGEVTRRDCCERGMLPLSDGSYVECPNHDITEH